MLFGGMTDVKPKIRVMVVDDEPDVCVMLSQSLRDEFDVCVLHSGVEALERLDRYEPDLVIMDVLMPTLDGFDTMRAIRKDQRYSKLPVLFLSAEPNNPALADGTIPGQDLFLAKPFSTGVLRKYLDDLIALVAVRPRPKQYSVMQVDEYYRARPDSLDSLPASTESSVPSAASRVSSVNIPRVRVLVVDDDRDLMRYTKSVLSTDYEVIGTTDSETAPDKIIAYQPDILVIDIHMPRLNGFQIAQLIRLNRRLRGAQIVFCSSRNDRESIANAYRLGAVQYIEKPFTPEQIKRKILEVIRQPNFNRTRKRVDFTEVQRREGD